MTSYGRRLKSTYKVILALSVAFAILQYFISYEAMKKGNSTPQEWSRRGTVEFNRREIHKSKHEVQKGKNDSSGIHNGMEKHENYLNNTLNVINSDKKKEFITTKLPVKENDEVIPPFQTGWGTLYRSPFHKEWKTNCSAVFLGVKSVLKETNELMAKFRENGNLPVPSDEEFLHHTENCEEFRRIRHYPMKPNSMEEEEYPLAYIITTHKEVAQVERLLRVIYQPQHVYCIHPDIKSPEVYQKTIRSLASCFDNVFIASTLESVQYAGFTRLQADINCMEDLLKHPIKWKYVMNLCGQDFPLKTNLEIVRQLKAYKDHNDINGIIPPKYIRSRTRMHHTINKVGKLMPTGVKKSPPPYNFTIYFGNAYYAVTHKFVNYVINDQRAVDLLKWSEDTWSPDEHYWVTLQRYPGVPGGYPNETWDEDIRFMKWGDIKRHPGCIGKYVRALCVFGIGYLKYMLTQPYLFANKFYYDFDPVTLQCIEEMLDYRTHYPRSVNNFVMEFPVTTLVWQNHTAFTGDFIIPRKPKNDTEELSVFRNFAQFLPPLPKSIPGVPSYNGSGVSTFRSKYHKLWKVDCSAIFYQKKKIIKQTTAMLEEEMVEGSLQVPSDQNFVRYAKDCIKFRSSRKYPESPHSKEEEDYPIAYIVKIHQDVAQFERLLRAIYQPQNLYCIHPDLKSPEVFQRAVESIVTCFDNVFVSSKIENVLVEGISNLQAEINCMADLLGNSVNWRYVINLEGKDFPLKTNFEIVQQLKSFSELNDIPGTKPGKHVRTRFEKVHTVDQNGNLVKTQRAKSSPPHNFEVYIGTGHYAVTYSFVEFVIHDEAAKNLLEWLKDTWYPQSIYWVTLNRFPGTPGGYPNGTWDTEVNFSKLKDVKAHPECAGKYVKNVCVFGSGYLKYLLSQPHLFARKFDYSFDPITMQCLEDMLDHRIQFPQSITYYVPQFPIKDLVWQKNKTL